MVLFATLYEVHSVGDKKSEYNNKNCIKTVISYFNYAIFVKFRIFNVEKRPRAFEIILDEWIVAFSLRKNVITLISTKRSADDIEAVHGIRFLNAIMLLLAHKSMALFFLPYANRTEMVEVSLLQIKNALNN